MNPGHKSTFSEKEVGALIQRATELYDEGNKGSAHRLNLKEVEHIAAELGIPMKYVRAAALEVRDGTIDSSSKSAGASATMVEHARLLDGEVSDEAWEDIVHAMKRLSGGGGEISEFGNTREFTNTFMEDDRTVLSVRSRDGETSVHVSTNFATSNALAHMLSFILPAVIAGILMSGSSLPDIVPWLAAGGSGVGGVLALRAYISVWKEKQLARLSSMADLVSDAIQSNTKGTLGQTVNREDIRSVSKASEEIEEASQLELPDTADIPTENAERKRTRARE